MSNTKLYFTPAQVGYLLALLDDQEVRDPQFCQSLRVHTTRKLIDYQTDLVERRVKRK